MTSDEIMSLAREAGFSVRGETIRTMHSSGAWVGINNELAKFAELVTSDELRRLHAENEALKASQIDVKSAMLQAAAMEREACALLCDNLQDVPATEPRHCAQDIRARGTP